MGLVREGRLEVGFVHKGLDEFTNRLEHAFNRLVVAMVVAGGLIGSSLIGIFAKNGPHVLGLHVISLIGFAFSGLLGEPISVHFALLDQLDLGRTSIANRAGPS